MAAARGRIAPLIEKASGQAKLVYLTWFVFLCDPQWVIGGKFGFRPALKLPTILVVTLVLALLMKPSRGDWLWLMFAWIATTAINFPNVLDLDRAMIPFRQMVFFYLLGLGVVRSIRSPQEAGPILFITCVGQYLWWAMWGIKYGQVPWHPNLANYDSYGPLMGVGVGPAYFYAMGCSNPTRKKLALAAAALCVIGVINSFARGAVLGLIVTVGYIWLRSPRKGRTGGMILVGGLVAIIAANNINGVDRGNDTKGNFFEEMRTMFDPAPEGEETTADDRKVLWSVATKVYHLNPWFGAGPENFGIAAATAFRRGIPGFGYGEIEGKRYAADPTRLAGRALHSNYFQLISEFGIIGTGIWVLMLVQFWFKNWKLHRPQYRQAWAAAGSDVDLRFIAVGLESGMVAFLVTGVFFNQLFVPWFYTLLFSNVLVYSIVISRMTAPPRLRATSRLV